MESGSLIFTLVRLIIFVHIFHCIVLKAKFGLTRRASSSPAKTYIHPVFDVTFDQNFYLS